MKILNASDAEFRRYGRIVTGLPLDGLLAALKKTPLPDGTDYVPRDDILHAAADVLVLFEIHVGMYVQQPVRQPVPKRFLVPVCSSSRKNYRESLPVLPQCGSSRGRKRRRFPGPLLR